MQHESLDFHQFSGEQKDRRESQSKKLKKESTKSLKERLDFYSWNEKLKVKEIFNMESVYSLASLVEKLENKLDSYDTIISDEVSARLVSLILRKIINAKRAEVQKKPANIYFVSSGRHNQPKIDLAVEKFIAEKSKDFGKTLLVSEYIETGRGMENFIKILEKNEIDFDLTVVSIDDKPGKYPEGLQKRMYYGSIGKAGLNFYGKQVYLGVNKNRDAGAHPSKLSGRGWDKFLPKNIELARQDANLVSQEILKALGGNLLIL